jgi:polygalacturonase
MRAPFDIAEFGARPDGKTLNTAAIQKAVDACAAAGGGRVFCGAGTFLTGSLWLRSRVELHLAPGCTLLGSARLADYEGFSAKGFRAEAAPEGSAKSLLMADGAEGLAITGPGEIHGQGPRFYDTGTTLWEHFYAKPPTARPRMLTLYRCRDLRIEGPSFVDSPCWTFWLVKCERVRIQRIRVLGDQRMINQDGLDLDACRDVTVSDCVFKTGDDCVVLRSIRSVVDEPAACEDVTVSGCELDSWCQGVRIGAPSDGTIRNCVFRDLIIRSRAHGITCDHPKGYLVPPNSAGNAEIHDIHFSDIRIDCKKTPVRLTVADGIALSRLENLGFRRFKIRSGGPCVVQGSPETIIRHVSFQDVEIETPGDEAVSRRHCENVTLDGVRLTKGPAAAS